jgi:cobalt-zinc-cadmium efflux system membrane fusion protein
MIRELLKLKFIVVGVVVLLVVGTGIAVAAVPGIRDSFTKLWTKAEKRQAGVEDDVAEVKLYHDDRGNAGLHLPLEAVQGLEIQSTPAKAAREPRPLPPQVGTVNYDNDRVFSIRPRFQGEIAWLRQVEDTSAGIVPTKFRPLRFGDPVNQDDDLAVVWSQSLGEKKGALVDALLTLWADQDTLTRHEKAWRAGSLSLATYRATEKQVRSDLNVVLTAERTLKMWKLTSTEIQQIKDEAKEIHEKKKTRSVDEETRWAEAKVKVPRIMALDRKDPTWKPNFVIVEKNTNVNDMVDPANPTPLFKIADLSRLQVWVHPPEEYLPILRKGLQERPGRLKWKLHFDTDGPNDPELYLPILQIAPSLEPNQHTPMVIGYLPNPDGKYLIGQFVTATIYVDPEPGTVEIPTAALNEVDGESLVFVQPNEKEHKYVLRRVSVVHRFKDVTFVRSALTEEDKKANITEVKSGRRPIQALQPNDRVVTNGVVAMTAALEGLVTKDRVEGQNK